MNIYNQLMEGFEKGNGVLHLPKILSKTRELFSVFPGYDSYGNHHGEDTSAALVCQRLCTTSIQNSTKMKELFDCLPTLKELIGLFELDYFGPKEERSFDYKLKIIDIL